MGSGGGCSALALASFPPFLLAGEMIPPCDRLQDFLSCHNQSFAVTLYLAETGQRLLETTVGFTLEKSSTRPEQVSGAPGGPSA